MSILIKGQSLPKDGEHYLIQINSDGTIYDAVGRRLVGVAVELPPHGDLIEKNAASLTDFEIAVCDGNFREGMIMLLDKIDNAPIIIEAEIGKGVTEC